MMNDIKCKEFIFGKDISPWWFLQAVDKMDVEYILERGKIQGCRFYKQDKEVIKTIGDKIVISELYTKMPKRLDRKEPSITIRHYPNEFYKMR